ncbi:MAG: TlpA disulfide reductase family protein [Armatimonadota bacterium]|nr:TlpA disulfide reductase family protein [Armatimonadota bacterium]MDR7436911.1 TlpA disulfide reductase family protein [Armatimonadota bacterium]MDR7472315.1 TlpA disulfide reductase family protein [Armatimonadota bacterium]MDR7506382.1 TlpA disulfide reductase family protein [Armatimonadota bacterium]MDR7508403.1 TlpA disulfide reductase family protein [Armatimonadota bacterium]
MGRPSWGTVLGGLVAASLAVAVVLAARTIQRPVAPGPTPPPSTTLRPAPDFRLRSFTGSLISLSDFRGDVVVLNFWASWCVPCREEMPNLERAWREFRSQRVTVLGINVADDYDDAAAFLRSLGITYPNVFDPAQTRMTAYRVTGLPTTAFIDRQMRIRATVPGGYLGAEGYATLRRQILTLVRASGTAP